MRPTGTADVVAAVTFAREHGLAVSVRAGGHNIAGTALADGGLALDMSGLRGIVVDPEARTATVQPGCLLGDVDRETQLHGLATPLGFISGVGVAGLTLGGGLGYLTRRFGWTVDNLLEVEIVTADGVVRRASRDHDADLFWGIRGAGANLGVVTSFTFRLHEVGPTVYGGLIAWPFERAAEIQDAYRALTAEAPRELAVWMNLMRAPAAPFVPEAWRGERVCVMVVCYSGELDRVDEVMTPIRALGDPVLDLLAAQPYTHVQSYLDATEPKGDHYYWKTGYASELGDELLATLRELAATCPIPRAQLGILHVGGSAERARGRRRRGRKPRCRLRHRRGRDVGARRTARRGVPGLGSLGRARGCARSPPAATTSTSRPPTKGRSASARATAPTTTGSSRSSAGTTRRTCSARTATSAPTERRRVRTARRRAASSGAACARRP